MTQSNGPDNSPRYAHALGVQFADTLAAAFGTPPDDDLPLIGNHEVGACARAVSFAAAGIDHTDPLDTAGAWTAGIEAHVLSLWQHSLPAFAAPASVRTNVVCAVDGIDGEFAAHAVIESDSSASPDGPTLRRRTVAMLNIIGGYAYKQIVGDKYEPRGPREQDVRQAALIGGACDADEVVIAYVSLEKVSPAAASRRQLGPVTRFAAEWTLSREEYEPVAASERSRLSGVLGLLDGDEPTLAARKIPDEEIVTGATVTDPTTGRWERWEATPDGHVGLTHEGNTYRCAYCPFRSACVLADDPGRFPLREVRERLAAQKENV